MPNELMNAALACCLLGFLRSGRRVMVKKDLRKARQMLDNTKKIYAPLRHDGVSIERELDLVRHAIDKSAIVAITDCTGQIIHINDKFCEISQFSRDELLGQNHRIINSGYHPIEFFVEMWKTISSGKVWEGEVRNKAKDGSYYWVYTTIIPFPDEKGEPYQYVSIRYDITQRKAAEEELARSTQASLEREAKIVMQDRLASIGLLASSLAHEIGTPLGVIRGRAEYIEIQVKNDPNVRKNVEIIISQIDRVSKLIHSLLNLARGNQTVHAANIEITDVVGEVIDLLAHEFRKNQIAVKNEIPGNTLIEVRAESGPLNQVVLNLLVNSIHAIQSEIKRGRASGHFVRVRAEDLGAHWALSFEDSGCGISETNMKNLFKPFFTTKDIGMGTGLGLATSYGIIESWGGSIEVKSSVGKGTEFRLILPKPQPVLGSLK